MDSDRVLRIGMQVLAMIRWFWRPGYFAIAISVLIAVGSLMPAENAQSLPGSDVAHHAFAYCLLSFFAMLAVTGRLSSRLVLLGVFGFGITLEFIQPFFGRFFDFNDVLTNAAGIVAGLGVAIGIRGVLQRLSRRQWLHGLY